MHSHAGYLTFKEGPNGFPIALITTPHATATITPPLRGGVPICCLWFDPDPELRIIQKMVCTEIANAGEDIIPLQPQESHTLKAVYFVKG